MKLKLNCIPNCLSALRLAAVGAMVAVFTEGRYTLSLIIYLAAMLTDFLDGWLARRYNWVTNIGKLLDPLADKLLQIAAVLCFYKAQLISWIPVALVLAKEGIMIAGAALLLGKKKRVVSSNWVGKSATVLFAAAVVLTFLHRWTNPWYRYVMFAAVVFSLAAMVQYGIKDVILPSVREKRARI